MASRRTQTQLVQVVDPGTDLAADTDTQVDQDQGLTAEHPLEPWDGYENIFWESEAGPTYKVLIRRLEPDVWPHPVNGRDVNVKGPLGYLPPGCNADWIFKNHGGGLFQLHGMDSGRLLKGKTRRLYLPGAPLVRDPNIDTAAHPGEPGPAAHTAPATFQMVNGVPVASTPEAASNYLQQALAYKKLLEQDSSTMTTELLRMLLQVVTRERQQADPTQQMLNTLEIMERMRDMAGDNGGSPLLGVLGKVAEAIGRNPRPAGPVPGRVLTTPKPVGELPKPTEEAEQVAAQPSFYDIAEEAVEQIVTHFLCVPQTPPAEVAEMLALVVPIAPNQRLAALGPWKRQLLNLGKTRVAQNTEEQSGLVAAWPDYYTQVFDAFCNPPGEAGT